MSSRVTIKQFTREEDGSFVAPFTPEHAIYDTNGKRLDVKIAGLDLDRISSALTHSEEAISAQTAESLQKIIDEQAEDRKRLDALDQGQISDNERITYLEKQTIPLALSYTSITPKAGTSERGTTFAPVVRMSIKWKANNVAAQSTVTVTPAVTLATNHEAFTGATISNDTTYKVSVNYDGIKGNFPDISYTFREYRYRGELSSVPSDYVSAIKGLDTQELNETATLGSTNLPANKYYLFAVVGNNTLVCRHASTGGLISGTVTGTCQIPRQNGTKNDNTYSYILVPKSEIAWAFTITNS